MFTLEPKGVPCPVSRCFGRHGFTCGGNSTNLSPRVVDMLDRSAKPSEEITPSPEHVFAFGGLLKVFLGSDTSQLAFAQTITVYDSDAPAQREREHMCARFASAKPQAS